MVSIGSRWALKLQTSLFVVRVTPPKKREGVSQTTDGGDDHPQELRLIQVQPQLILLHPLQYSLQTALKGQNGIHWGGWEGDVELSALQNWILTANQSKVFLLLKTSVNYIVDLQCPLTLYLLYLQLEEAMIQTGHTSSWFPRSSYENLITAPGDEIHNRSVTIPDTVEQMEINIRCHTVIYILSFFDADSFNVC